MAWSKPTGMHPKSDQKLEKQFMAFGSIMNSLQGQMKLEDVEKAWELAKRLVSEFVEEIFAAESSDEKPF